MDNFSSRFKAINVCFWLHHITPPRISQVTPQLCAERSKLVSVRCSNWSFNAGFHWKSTGFAESYNLLKQTTRHEEELDGQDTHILERIITKVSKRFYEIRKVLSLTLPPSLILVVDTADREDRVDIAPLRLNSRQPITIGLEAETANQRSAVFEHDFTWIACRQHQRKMSRSCLFCQWGKNHFSPFYTVDSSFFSDFCLLSFWTSNLRESRQPNREMPTNKLNWTLQLTLGSCRRNISLKFLKALRINDASI